MSQTEKQGAARSPYFNVVQAANYLGLKRQTLDNFRWAGGGPKYRKHGGRVLYKRDELDAWSDAHAFENTGQRARPAEQ